MGCGQFETYGSYAGLYYPMQNQEQTQVKNKKFIEWRKNKGFLLHYTAELIAVSLLKVSVGLPTCLCALSGVVAVTRSSWILRTGGAPLLSFGVGTTGCGAEPGPSPATPRVQEKNPPWTYTTTSWCDSTIDILWSLPAISVRGEARLNGRGWGVAGAGRSPIKKPGRNWAPGAGLGDVGEPRVIGSDPTEETGADTPVWTNIWPIKRQAVDQDVAWIKMLRFWTDRIIKV